MPKGGHGRGGYGFRFHPHAMGTPVAVEAEDPGPGEGEEITSFSLTTAAVSGTYPFTIGVGFAEGDADDVTTDLGNAQVDVMRTWNDGSVKHAIISGRAALTQDVPLTVNLSTGTQSEGAALTASDIEDAAPTASVQCGAIGTVVDLGDLLASPVRTWISGSEMVECHYRADVGGGTLLSVWFHVRLYADDRVWIRAIVENGYLDNGAGALASFSDQSYVPTLIIGGVTVYNNGGASLTHYKYTRYSAEGWIGGDPEVVPAHDVAYLMASKLVPNYAWTEPSELALDSLTGTYTQMSNGDHEAGMGAAGFQPGIGLLSKWDALYCTSGDARAFASVLANSSHLNSYPICWRPNASKTDAAHNVAKPSSFPTWTLDGPGGGGNPEFVAGGLTWEVNHHPSSGFLAYLLTGDFWHYESMAMQAAMCYLCGTSGDGSGTDRLMRRQPRGTAWCLRTVGQYTAIAPSSDTTADDYRELLGNNFVQWAVIADANPSSDLGILYSVAGQTFGVPAPTYIGPFMQRFWEAVNGYTWDLEPGYSGATLTAHQTTRDFMYRGIVGMLGPNGAENYCYTAGNAETADIPQFLVLNDELNSETFFQFPESFFETWGEVYTASFSEENTSCGASLEGTLSQTGSWSNVIPAIAYAYEHGATGAVASLTRLSEASNWTTLWAAGFNDVPNWGISPRGWSGDHPSWRQGQAVGEWREISGSSLSLAPVKDNVFYPGQNGVSGKQDAWASWALDRDTSKIYSLANGGHLDYFGNEVDVLDLEDDEPAFSELITPSAFADVTDNADYYADDLPCSRHSYRKHWFIESMGRAMMLGVGSRTKSGNPGSAVDGFNPATDTFDAAGTYTSLPYVPAAGGDPMAKHPTTENVYAFNQNEGVYEWAKGTPGSWSQLSTGFPPVSAQASATAIDPTRGTGGAGNMLVLGGTGSAHHVVDIGAETISAITLTGALASSITGNHCGLDYEPDLDRFLFRTNDAGGTVYSIHPSTWAVEEFSTTDGGSIPSSEHILTRWAYVPRLSGFYLAPKWSANVWFLRTH
jgi:hypothetical protein